MTLNNRAMELYEAQYRLINQSGPGGWFEENVCTSIGAVPFVLEIPTRIKVYTYFIGVHSINAAHMLSPYRGVADAMYMRSPYRNVANANQSDHHEHPVSFLYLYANIVKASFDIAKDILFVRIHSAHDN